jgi:hypothetical protein
MPGPPDHALVTDETREDLADPVHLEDGPDLPRLRLDDGPLVGTDRRIADEPLQLLPVHRDFVLGDELLDGEEAVTLVRLELGDRDRPRLARRAPYDRVLAGRGHLGGAAAGVEIGEGGHAVVTPPRVR